MKLIFDDKWASARKSRGRCLGVVEEVSEGATDDRGLPDKPRTGAAGSLSLTSGRSKGAHGTANEVQVVCGNGRATCL